MLLVLAYGWETGRVIAGKYRVEGVLGEGGMGMVLGARHLDLDRRVAIKVLRPELGSSDDFVRRLMFEARAAAKIQSEHVCRVLDVGKLEDSTPFIVMEHLDGLTLAALLEYQGRIREEQAVGYILDVCQALAEAHAAGIVHRDIKPENLFLARRPDGSRSIKVLDFGVSKATADSALQGFGAVTHPETTLGSPFYMAPEQLDTRSELDHRVDIWALGAVLYQLTTGHCPFDGETIPAVFGAILGLEPTPPRMLVPELSVALEATILRCLRKEREQRFSSVAELAQALATSTASSARHAAERVSSILGAIDARRPAQQWPETQPAVGPWNGDRNSQNGSLLVSVAPATPPKQGGVPSTESSPLPRPFPPAPPQTSSAAPVHRTAAALLGTAALAVVAGLLTLVVFPASRDRQVGELGDEQPTGSFAAGSIAPNEISVLGASVASRGEGPRASPSQSLPPGLPSVTPAPAPSQHAPAPTAERVQRPWWVTPRSHGPSSPPKVAPPPPASTEPVTMPPDAWDRTNFGGRR